MSAKKSYALRRFGASAGFLTLLFAGAASAACTFRSLGPVGSFGDIPRDVDISGDGSTIVGSRPVVRDFTDVPDSERALLWTEQAFRWRSPCDEARLPWRGPLCIDNPVVTVPRLCVPDSSFAVALSHDGSVVGGRRGDPRVENLDGYLWHEDGGVDPVPAIGFGVFDVSADASVLLAGTPSGNARVISPAGSTDLGLAWDLSDDGSVVVGGSFLSLCPSPLGPRFASFWRGATGTLALPGTGAADYCTAAAMLVSGDGSVVLGVARSGFPFARNETVRWEIGPDATPGTDDDTVTVVDRFAPMDLTPDGRTAVGSTTDVGRGAHEALIWTPASGPILVSEIAANECDADLRGWRLVAATGISDDGTRIVGTGWDPSGQPVGWLLDRSSEPFDWDGDGVPEPDDNCSCDRNPDQWDADADAIGNRCDADFDQTGQTTVADLLHLLGCLGGSDPLCDLNANGLVGQGDLRRFRRLARRGQPGPSDLRERAPSFIGPAALHTHAAHDAALDVAPTLIEGPGTWLAVWASNDPLDGSLGADFDLLTTRSIDAGASWSPPAPLHPHFAADSGSDAAPQLAPDGAGGFLAVWQSTDPLDGSLGTDPDLLVARSGDAGRTWSAPRALHGDLAHDAEDDLAPQVAGDASGRLVAVWERSGAVWVARSGDGGDTWSAPAAVVPGSPRVQRNPQVATDGAGNWVAIWQADAPASRDFEVQVARSQDGGSTWSAPQAVMSGVQPAGPADRAPVYPRVAHGGRGRWLAAWRSAASLAAAPLELTRSWDGRVWSRPRPLAGGAAAAGAFELVSDGRVWLAVWSSADPLRGTLGADLDLMAAISPNGGARWLPFVLQPNAALDAGADTSPRVVPGRAGRWLAVWQSDDGLGGTLGSDPDILWAVAAP